MFDKIKNFFSGLALFFQYGDVVRSFTTAYTTYPGLDDADLLRVWIRPLLTDASSLSTITQTRVDDMIVYAAIRIVDDNHAWSAVHSMAMLLRDGMHTDATLVPGDSGDMFETVRKVSEDVMPQCPSAVLSAIGLILFLLQRRSAKG